MATSDLNTALDEYNWSEFEGLVHAAVSDKALEFTWDFSCARIETFNQSLKELVRSFSEEGMTVAEVAAEVSKRITLC